MNEWDKGVEADRLAILDERNRYRDALETEGIGIESRAPLSLKIGGVARTADGRRWRCVGGSE